MEKRWSEEPSDVQEALWLGLYVKGLVERLRDSKTSPAGRAEALAKVRAAQHAIDGVNPMSLSDRLQVLVSILETVVRDADQVTEATDPFRREKLAWCLRTGFENRFASSTRACSDDLLAEAVEKWPEGGAARWESLLPVARALGAVTEKTTAQSLGERVSRLRRQP